MSSQISVLLIHLFSEKLIHRRAMSNYCQHVKTCLKTDGRPTHTRTRAHAHACVGLPNVWSSVWKVGRRARLLSSGPRVVSRQVDMRMTLPSFSPFSSELGRKRCVHEGGLGRKMLHAPSGSLFRRESVRNALLRNVLLLQLFCSWHPKFCAYLAVLSTH